MSEAGFFYDVKSLCLYIVSSSCSLLENLKNSFSKTSHKLQTCLSFSGKDDHVICFHCGIMIGEWLETDKPWGEHAKWSPTCLYVIHLKGKEFVDASQRLQSNKE
jgi:hypothetical protein